MISSITKEWNISEAVAAYVDMAKYSGLSFILTAAEIICKTHIAADERGYILNYHGL